MSVRSLDRVHALSSNAGLIAAFNLPLAALTGWLLWRSRDWPLIGDATILHFIAGQMRMGAVPYRDIVDINMPLTYGIHAAVVAIGGMSDAAWRAFDLMSAALLCAFILLLVAPAQRSAAILAALAVLVMHLLLGPYAAGQRDFLMSIPAVAAAWASARAAEDHQRGSPWLLLVGALSMTAAFIKPTGVLLLLLPALAMKLSLRAICWILAGAAGVAIAVLAALVASGALGAFTTIMKELLPAYSAIGARPLPEVLAALQWIVPIAGLALAAALSVTAPSALTGTSGKCPQSPRVRVMIGLAVFGLIHLLVQRKGWAYHVYPLGIGLACLGAWALAALPMSRVLVCLAVMTAALAWAVLRSTNWVEDYAPLRAAAAMQSALESHLPRRARVQMLDADNGAFLAMARAGMRQATPHIQWYSLLLAGAAVPQDFLAALEANPPAGILLTNAQWPRWPGFEAADEWPQFQAFLASHYDLRLTGQKDYIAWRFYLRTR